MSRHEIVGCGTDAVAPPHFVGESAHIDLVQGRNELRLGEFPWAHGNRPATVDYSAESLPFELVLDLEERGVAEVGIVYVFLFHFYDCRILWRVFDLNDQRLNHGIERWLDGWGVIFLRVYRVKMSFKMVNMAMATQQVSTKSGGSFPSPTPSRLTLRTSHSTV